MAGWLAFTYVVGQALQTCLTNGRDYLGGNLKRLNWTAVLLVVALIGAGCGRSDSSGDPSDTTSTTGSGAKSANFGDLVEVCQDGDPSGSPAQGVSPSEIRVGTFSDPGFVGRQGLNQELFDTAEVFAAWCNARGGINGREIVVDELDGALFNVKAKMTEACSQDFMLVGGGSVFDQDGVTTRLACMLPDIAGYAVSPEVRGSDLLVQPVPNSNVTFPVGDLVYLGKEYPASTKAVGVLTGDLATTKLVGAQTAEGAKSLGWDIVYDDLYPPAGVTDWTPYAQGIKDKGVKGLLWVGEPENLAALMKAITNIGYKLDWARADANHYDQKLIDLAGSSLSTPVYIRSGFEPFEDATDDNATGQYLAAFKEYLPEGKNRTYLGLQAWSAWLLFAEAAKECGNDLTRKCVYSNAKKIHEWTGGGLHSKSDPGTSAASPCFAIERATPKGFELVTDIKPNDGIFNCNPDNVYKLKGDYPPGVTLKDVGKKLSDLK